MTRSHRLMAVALAGAAGLVALPATAATYAHAMVVSGQANSGDPSCATSGPQAKMAQFFNTGVPLPGGGYAGCGLAGGIQDVSNAAGASAAHIDVANAFNGGLNVASGDAVATEGVLGASAANSFDGDTNSLVYKGAEGAAMFSDTFSQADLAGGSIQMTWSIDGDMSFTGNAQGITRFNYQFGTGPIVTAFAAGVGPSPSSNYAFDRIGNMPGFTVTASSVGGSGTVTFIQPVGLAGTFDLTVGLYTAAYAGSAGDVINDFFSTARLTGISMWDSAGRSLAVDLTSASGTIYDANGAHPALAAVPEPAAWAMLILGFAGVGASLRRHASDRRQSSEAACA
jgi:hypothetical protein